MMKYMQCKASESIAVLRRITLSVGSHLNTFLRRIFNISYVTTLVVSIRNRNCFGTSVSWGWSYTSDLKFQISIDPISIRSEPIVGEHMN
jgi:hypothetical protein